MMEGLRIFQTTAGILVALFVFYGMDVRRKGGAHDFVAPIWQALLKLCAFSLTVAFAGIAMSATHTSAIDWSALAMMAAGTAFVVAAKRALGNAHTFTGQFLGKPRLVTHGVFALTRNPLYFGVFLCEAGAALFVAHQAPELFPLSHPYGFAALAMALAYAVAFNWSMALNEARYLQDCFGDAYRQYQARVPFLIPSIRLKKEIE
jgi:protein-S-isoprenylcysteine O-methyltransferase Ste14